MRISWSLTRKIMRCDAGWVWDCNACYSQDQSKESQASLILSTYYNVPNVYAIKIDGKCLKYGGSGNMAQLDICDITNVNLFWTFTFQTSQSSQVYLITSYAVSPSTPVYLYLEDNGNCWLYAESSYSNIKNILWDDASFAYILTVTSTIRPTYVPTIFPSTKPTTKPTTFPSIVPTYASTMSTSKETTLTPTKLPVTQSTTAATTYTSTPSPSTQPFFESSNIPTLDTTSSPTVRGTLHKSSPPSTEPTSFSTDSSETNGSRDSTPLQDRLTFKWATPTTSGAASLLVTWFFSEKIAFYVINNWGYDYKFLYKENSIEHLDRQISKVTKTKVTFDKESNLLDLVFMVIKDFEANNLQQYSVINYLHCLKFTQSIGLHHLYSKR